MTDVKIGALTVGNDQPAPYRIESSIALQPPGVSGQPAIMKLKLVDSAGAVLFEGEQNSMLMTPVGPEQWRALGEGAGGDVGLGVGLEPDDGVEDAPVEDVLEDEAELLGRLGRERLGMGMGHERDEPAQHLPELARGLGRGLRPYEVIARHVRLDAAVAQRDVLRNHLGRILPSQPGLVRFAGGIADLQRHGSLRHDLGELLPDDPRAASVARRVATLAETLDGTLTAFLGLRGLAAVAFETGRFEQALARYGQGVDRSADGVVYA